MNPSLRRLLVVLLWLTAPVLLWLALKDIPLAGISATLKRLHAWQIVVLVTVNIAILLLINWRWYLVLQALRQPVSFLTLLGYRLAGFAVSYFTPGTQFGGEPLQVLLLQKQNSVSSAAAVSSVYIDKLLELLSNFTFLVFGLLVFLRSGFIAYLPNAWLGWLIPLVFILAGLHLISLWMGHHPLGAVLKKLCQFFPGVGLFCRLHDSTYQAEEEIIIFARQRPTTLIGTLLISAAIWGLMIYEFGLVYQYLGADFQFNEMVIALVLARFSFLVPVPAGLGALEGSQVLAMTLLGIDPAIGVAACLWIRTRDVITGLIGVWLGSRYARMSIHISAADS